MMKRLQRISKMALVMALLITSFSGSLVAVQAADPWHRDNRWEQRDDRDYRNDRDHRNDRHDRWDKKDEKSKAQQDADDANKKANWALGIAVVAGIIAATK